MEARVEKPHRIAGYCRISVDVEADRDNTSIENQKDIISDYVQRYFPESELTFFVDRDRSGYTFEQLLELSDPFVKKLLGQLDLLVDGPFIMAEKNIELRFRGSANQRVLDVPKSLEANEAVWAEQYR